MLSRIRGRRFADEHREPTLDVVMRARERRWNWLGCIFPRDENSVLPQVLINCIELTLFSDDTDLDNRNEVELPTDRAYWKILKHSKRGKHLHREMQ